MSLIYCATAFNIYICLIFARLEPCALPMEFSSIFEVIQNTQFYRGFIPTAAMRHLKLLPLNEMKKKNVSFYIYSEGVMVGFFT